MNKEIKFLLFGLFFSTQLALPSLVIAKDKDKKPSTEDQFLACSAACRKDPAYLDCQAQFGSVAEKCFKIHDVCKRKKGC